VLVTVVVAIAPEEEIISVDVTVFAELEVAA
jgi:hypothetical protein